MARIQTLILPTADENDVPFLIVIDEADSMGRDLLSGSDVCQRLKDQTGARAVLVFPGTVDVV